MSRLYLKELKSKDLLCKVFHKTLLTWQMQYSAFINNTFVMCFFCYSYIACSIGLCHLYPRWFVWQWLELPSFFILFLWSSYYLHLVGSYTYYFCAWTWLVSGLQSSGTRLSIYCSLILFWNDSNPSRHQEFHTCMSKLFLWYTIKY